MNNHVRGIALLAIGALLLTGGSVQAAGGDAKAGKTVYVANCMVCHGPNGDGKGSAAAGLNPKPRNFRDDKYMTDKTDAQLINSIKNGTTTPGSAMPAWGDILTEKQTVDVLAYIRTFSKCEVKAPTAEPTAQPGH